MDQKTEYAKEQEQKHKRKIILPSVISWEYGSNKFASQKGQRAFGTIRNIKVILKENEEIPVKYPGSLEVEQLPRREDVEEEKIQEEPQKAPSGPMFQNSGNGESDSYKSWIGGQMTTFQPSSSLSKQESDNEEEEEEEIEEESEEEEEEDD